MLFQSSSKLICSNSSWRGYPTAFKFVGWLTHFLSDTKTWLVIIFVITTILIVIWQKEGHLVPTQTGLFLQSLMYNGVCIMCVCFLFSSWWILKFTPNFKDYPKSTNVKSHCLHWCLRLHGGNVRQKTQCLLNFLQCYPILLMHVLFFLL